MIQPRVRHWDAWSAELELTSLRQAEFAGVVMATRRLLRGQREPLRILDLGCGPGYIDVLLAASLVGSIVACDMSSVALERARGLLERTGTRDRVALVKVDGYSLPFRDGAFDLVVSFGRASVGAYLGIQAEVRRVLKPSGLAVIDFINTLSIYQLAIHPLRTLGTYRRWRRGEEKMYHWGPLGIRGAFREHGLEAEKQTRFYVYPNFALLRFVPARWLIAGERWAAPLRALLGRGILVRFRAM